ncbi:glycosyltransferase family 39 protein [Gordonia sputi]|uniref:flagellar motor control protein ZomB n=1 Tax=Gordonia sputi TaxID=36823 RepID=UPI00204490B4|nr:flagellar motor control protein ZomB [Gordonia sputi]MCM3894230.1 glycosyltransferase family 39 protein [Gordonia sputi]
MPSDVRDEPARAGRHRLRETAGTDATADTVRDFDTDVTMVIPVVGKGSGAAEQEPGPVGGEPGDVDDDVAVGLDDTADAEDSADGGDTADAGDEDAAAGPPPGAGRRRFLSSWGPREWTATISFLIGAIGVTTFFAIGAWQRRWIADDGLIVLRTLRNLFAGNGPVFNAGERVEANTSTAWTYLLWFWAWVTDGQLEYVALWVALVLSVSAIPIAMYGTARLLGPRISGPAATGITLLLPLGAIVYVAIPPARDFATSGLENGLCIFWVAVLWCLLIAWSRRRAKGDVPQNAGARRTAGYRGAAATLFLAFWAGLAPLIRPELTVVGGIALLLVFLAPLSWKMRVGVVVCAAVLPVGYQIFRMGYYALLVPNPAVAKDASGSKWHQGFIYLGNLFGPYTLVLPVILAIVAGVLIVIGTRMNSARTRDDSSAEASSKEKERPTVRERLSRWSRDLQTPTAVTVAIVVAGLIDGVYWLRQGGDFMHGRVLLTSMFTILLPVMVVPLSLPALAEVRAAFGRGVDAAKDRDRRRRVLVQLGGATVMAALWITTLVWAIVCHEKVLPNAGIDIGRSGIVDERRFYVTNMGNENPVTAADYLDYPRMRAMVERIDEYRTQGGVILPSNNYDEWYVAKLPDNTPQDKRKATVYFLNLGMTSMNAPLDVRVIDQMGLAYPIAAHTERLEDGRIGHDKNLPAEWVIAESGAYPKWPVLPGFLDEDMVAQAKEALTCSQTVDRIESYKDTWSFARFKKNLPASFGFSDYRIQRNPEYELQRCGLPVPPRLHPR